MLPLPAFARLGEENAFAVLDRAAELTAQGRDVVNLGIGQPDMPTPGHIVEAAVRALRDGRHGYPPAVGIEPLREAVAADLHRRPAPAARRRGVAAAGAGRAGRQGHHARGRPDARPARRRDRLPGPRVPDLPLAGGVHRRDARTRAGPGGERLRRRRAGDPVAAHGPHPAADPHSPGNPTGGVTPRTELDALIAGLAQWPDVAVLSDEIYGAMTYDGEQHHSLLRYAELKDRLILLDGASKTYAMTGWRLGWSVWPPALHDAARKLAGNSWSCVNAAAQWAGVAALTGPQDCVTAMVAEFDRRRTLVVGGLNDLPGVACATPKGAFYAFPNISGTGWRAQPLADALLEQAGVAVIGGPDFGPRGEGHLRLSCTSSTASIEQALERIRALLASAGPATG